MSLKETDVISSCFFLNKPKIKNFHRTPEIQNSLNNLIPIFYVFLKTWTRISQYLVNLSNITGDI